MDTNADLSISRWETALSDLDGLFFVNLVDGEDVLRLTIEDRGKQLYEVAFERPGPYRVAHEQFLTHYWNASSKRRGWTFRVTGADWLRDYELLDHYLPGVEHFVVATWDICLEVLASSEPRIRVL